MGSKTDLQPVASVLFNANLYFLHYVVIVITGEKYRLLVILDNRVLWDKEYKTVKGARIAFNKLFKERAWHAVKKSLWSPFFPPDNDWLQEKLNLANSVH